MRALRHYHQIGLLDEPERRANGYREYGPEQLVRVLRIRHLAALGIPLDHMGTHLDSTDGDRATLLDELDAGFASEIERLTAQRRLVAQLRAQAGPLDAPPELAPFLAALAAAESTDLAALDRDRAVLLAGLAGNARMPDLVRLYERLAAPDLATATAELGERFATLDPEASAAASDALVADFEAVVLPLIADLATADPPLDLDAVAPAFRSLAVGDLNAEQRAVMDRLEASAAAEHARIRGSSATGA